MQIDIRDPSDYSAVVAQQATDTASQDIDRTHERNARMEYRDILMEKHDGIARITLNRPEALNAFREPMRVELEATTMELARQLTKSATAAIGLAKTIMHRSAELNFYAFLEYEALATTVGTQTEDHKEGIRAFVEKRPPQFKGH